MASIQSRSAERLPGLGQLNNGQNISLSLNSSPAVGGEGAVDITVKISPPADGTRTATDVCCVVDVSGSMGCETQNGDAESQGLSVLDIVKHACKTVIHSLTPSDRFALVAYSSQATVKLPLTVMDDAGKASADAEVDGLRAGGQTNLWDGLHSGLQVLNEGADHDHMAAVLLLTDGQPNVIPPRGHIPMLQQYKDEHDLICSISTFGFGYSLDSQLLQDLAIEGQGQFAFIPDGSFVGTAFINATSNILSTAARQLVLKLSNVGDADSVDVLGYSKTLTKASWGLQVPLGSITFGQSKDVVLRVPGGSALAQSGGAGLRADLDYMLVSPDRLTTFVEGGDGGGGGGGAASSNDAAVQALRAQFVVTVRGATEAFRGGDQAGAQATVASFVEQVKAAMADNGQEPRLPDLLADLEGQVTEALSRTDWFNKWGRHYLPSLVNAHHLQQCNNFKDPGVQHYGGALFQALRDTAEQVFLKLPPPTPTARSSYSSYRGVGAGAGARAAPAAAAAPVDMSMYYNAGGGCFTGASRVLMADGSLKRADALQAGDRVATSMGADNDDNDDAVADEEKNKENGNGVAVVKYVVETEVAAGDSTLLVTVPHGTGRLQVTAWHPIWLAGHGWTFPAHLAAAANALAQTPRASQEEVQQEQQQTTTTTTTTSTTMAKCRAAFFPREEVRSVFNLVLEEHATHAIIEGVPTIALAHGIADDAVAAHAYYGSQRVVEDLEAHFRPNARGVIRVPAGAMELVRGSDSEGDECGHGRVVKAVPRRTANASCSSSSTPLPSAIEA